MINYSRNLSSKDINALGPDWNQKIDNVVGTMIETSIIANDPKSANSRVLGSMGFDIPLTISGIVANYNIVNGPHKISLNYARTVVANLRKAGLIERIKTGVYIRPGFTAPHTPDQ